MVARREDSETRRYARKGDVLSRTTEHYLKMCLLMDPGLVYGFTKPFDDYFRDHTDPAARSAVTKFLTQRCEVPGPVASRLMASPNFYHPAIFQVKR
jgi:hypothetical protein